MLEPNTDVQETNRTAVMAAGLLLLIAGLALNYIFERHNIFKLWENSRFPISWADFFYPPICVLLSLAGFVLFIYGALRQKTIRRSFTYAVAIALPFTVLYTLFAFGIQFVASGADRLGECPALDEAAASSNAIPESKWETNHPAVGCAVERRGMFLSYYNDLGVYGVTDAVAQQRILDKLTEHYQQAHTHPVQVRFFEKENISIREGRNGAVFRSAGPVKLIRVVNIG
jgi:uncharacterized membrane protein